RRTGEAPRRHHGKLYAARGLVYEECRRDVQVRLGPQVVAPLAAPLTLVLESARWLAADLTRRFDERLAEIHDAMFAQDSSAPVDSLPFFQRVFATVFGQAQGESFLAAARREFRERWSRVLALDPAVDRSRARRTAAELRPRFDAEFAERGPSWGLVRYISPDLLIAARSEQAFRDGDFQLVL